MFPRGGEYGLVVRVSTVSEGGTVKVYLDDVSARIWGESFGLLGTDNYGRDIFTQLMHGSRISIIVGIFSAVIAVALGVLVGLTSGYIGGWVDELLMRVNDILLTIPGLPFLIVLTAVLGPTILSVIILIGFLGWMGIARLIRSQVLTLKTKAFVEASRASGGGTWHIIRVHLIPNVMTMAYTQLALTVPGAIVTEAALSFLGLGDPFLQTWGKMLHDVQYYGAVAEWWWAVPPGLCIALLSMSFVFIGYALDDIFNPKLRGR
jgi:peptide/nickel transport system permease protein